jgi:hypothetical protein
VREGGQEGVEAVADGGMGYTGVEDSPGWNRGGEEARKE